MYIPYISKVADNIISPLGLTTQENLAAVLDGRVQLGLHHGLYDLPEDFCGSVMAREAIDHLFSSECTTDTDYTFFEKLCILSASRAISLCGLCPSDPHVLFVLSSTKGNVDLLSQSLAHQRCYIASSAHRVAQFFGNTNQPIVVSNACISGVCAQIAAVRQLLSARYHTAVVIGCDVLSRFVISGFQSFKALSPSPCRPYDNDRTGLNLGEAVSTLILQSHQTPATDLWHYCTSSIHNDANHISGPSRTGEGAYRVLSDILQHVHRDQLSCVCTHGTATPYNDEMESIALHRAQLDATPVCGLKGYFGHTLGAAGVLETVLAMASLDRGIIPATRGYATQGTTHKLNVQSREQQATGNSFIKLMSGFGGSNAGIAYTKGGES